MAPSNQDDFDGYRKWLGISNKKRPPTHYELLSISLDEDDPEVIHAAAEQRRNFVESKRGDGHDAIVTEILYRISEAETILLNNEMRRGYDRQLNLFEKRQRNRQVDPNAPRSRIRSRPGPTVGESTGFVSTFAGILGVFCVALVIMTWFSFQLPWSKEPQQTTTATDLQGPLPAPGVNLLQEVSDEPKSVQAVAPANTSEPSTGDVTVQVIKALQGEWLCVAAEELEKQIDVNDVAKQDRRATFNENSFKMMRTYADRKGYTGTFKIDATNGHFDFAGNGPDGDSIAWIGIYELNGDDLRLCYRYNKNGEALRPTEFKTDDLRPNFCILHTYKRVAPVSQNDDATATAVKALQGEWMCVDTEGGGTQFSSDFVKAEDRRVTFQGDQLTMVRTKGERQSYIGKFQVNASNRDFDFIGKGPDQAPNQWIGIYELSGDILKICYRKNSTGDAVRPKEFKTDVDQVNFCMCLTLRRVKDR